MALLDIDKLKVTDIQEAAQALSRAFHDDPLQTYVLPDPEQRAQRSPDLFATLLHYGHQFGEAFISAGGAAVWIPPGGEITPERAAQSGLDQLPSILGQDAFIKFGQMLDFLQPLAAAAMPQEFWYLMVVGVEPNYQGRGVGTALLRPILKRADEARVPCYLETFNDRNIVFYERLGFEIARDVVEPLSGLRVWTLRRDPRVSLDHP